MYSWSAPHIRDVAGVPQRRSAIGAVVAGIAGLGVLALLLPTPFPLTGPSPSGVGSVGVGPSGGGAVAVGVVTEHALLSAAGLTVWILLGWQMLVVASALLGRMPGQLGRGGRAMLRRLAPWSAARVVAAAVGLTLLSGTSACAAGLTPGGTEVGGSATETVSTSTSVSVSVPTTDTGSPAVPSGGAGSDHVITSMSIDWPDSGSAVVTSATAGPPGSVAPPRASAVAPAPAPAPASPVPVPARTGAGAETGPGPAAARIGPDPAVAPARAGPVTVRTGDSLWAIAHRFLPADATDAETDMAWRAWYVANSQTIGDNPDLIRPGQLLLPPTSRTG